jgi:hypothetical protein
VIFFLAPGRYRYYMREFLEGLGSALAPRMEILSHQEAHAMPPRPGTYVFAGVQQLSPAGRARVAETWLGLSRFGSAVRMLNHPLEILGRYELLRTLHSTGVNAFNARRLSEAEPQLRFPVFIRHERGHRGSLTRLLRNQRELDDAGEMLELLDDPGNLLVVEFCDTSDDQGVFRKYGAFVVGERVIPRSLLFSRHWVVKDQGLIDKDKLREEREFLDTNPHGEWLRETSRVAGVEYGRIDYALLGGRPQVWEINTNPVFMSGQEEPTSLSHHERVARRLVAAFEELDRVGVVSGQRAASPS